MKKDNVSRETMKFAKPGKRKTAENTKKEVESRPALHTSHKKQRFSLFLARKPSKKCYKRTKKQVFSEKRNKKHGKTAIFSPESLISDAIFAFFFGQNNALNTTSGTKSEKSGTADEKRTF